MCVDFLSPSLMFVFSIFAVFLHFFSRFIQLACCLAHVLSFSFVFYATLIFCFSFFSSVVFRICFFLSIFHLFLFRAFIPFDGGHVYLYAIKVELFFYSEWVCCWYSIGFVWACFHHQVNEDFYLLCSSFHSSPFVALYPAVVSFLFSFSFLSVVIFHAFNSLRFDSILLTLMYVSYTPVNVNSMLLFKLNIFVLLLSPFVIVAYVPFCILCIYCKYFVLDRNDKERTT